MVLERNKMRAMETREERKREHLAEKELVALTVSTEDDHRKLGQRGEEEQQNNKNICWRISRRRRSRPSRE